MRELIDAKLIERTLLFLAVAGPLVGLIVGTMLGAHERRSTPRIVAGVLIGSLGAVVYGLWRLYGVITDALGLDSAANLGLQLVMFALFGALLGGIAFKISVMLKRAGAAK